MTPTLIINYQYESRCYVNSSFQVRFFNIYFRQLILNIDYERFIEELYGSEYEFSANFQKNLTLRVIQHISCEMLTDGRKIVYTDSFFEVTNIKRDVQIYSLEFGGLLHKMVRKEPYINQERGYSNKKGENNASTVSDYILF